MANKINNQWHLAHRMPENPSLNERVKWHVAHVRNCKCREITASIMEEMKSGIPDSCIDVLPHIAPSGYDYDQSRS